MSPEGIGVGDGDASSVKSRDEGPTFGGMEVVAVMGEPLTTDWTRDKRSCTSDTGGVAVGYGGMTELSLVEVTTTLQHTVFATCVCVQLILVRDLCSNFNIFSVG